MKKALIIAGVFLVLLIIALSVPTSYYLLSSKSSNPPENNIVYQTGEGIARTIAGPLIPPLPDEVEQQIESVEDPQDNIDEAVNTIVNEPVYPGLPNNNVEETDTTPVSNYRDSQPPQAPPPPHNSSNSGANDEDDVDIENTIYEVSSSGTQWLKVWTTYEDCISANVCNSVGYECGRYDGSQGSGDMDNRKGWACYYPSTQNGTSAGGTSSGGSTSSGSGGSSSSGSQAENLGYEISDVPCFFTDERSSNNKCFIGRCEKGYENECSFNSHCKNPGRNLLEEVTCPNKPSACIYTQPEPDGLKCYYGTCTGNGADCGQSIVSESCGYSEGLGQKLSQCPQSAAAPAAPATNTVTVSNTSCRSLNINYIEIGIGDNLENSQILRCTSDNLSQVRLDSSGNITSSYQIPNPQNGSLYKIVAKIHYDDRSVKTAISQVIYQAQSSGGRPRENNPTR